jgi:hypothetical protein
VIETNRSPRLFYLDIEYLELLKLSFCHNYLSISCYHDESMV